MKNLIIYYSPNPESFTVYLAEELQKILQRKNQQVVMRNLLQTKLDPILSLEDITLSEKGKYRDDVVCEQKYVAEAENLIFIYPLYQLSMPAMMKGYIDRVLTQNFSHNYNADGSINPLMKGKTVSILSPMKVPFDISVLNGDIAAINHISEAIFKIRGFEIKNICYFDFKQREQILLTLQNLF